MPPQELQVAEEEIKADAPRDGRERKVMALHSQRDETERQRNQQRDREPDGEREPWRSAGLGREVGSGIGADAHEGGLPERRLPRHPGQEHQSQCDDAVQPDVIAERHPELRGERGDARKRRDQRDEADPIARHSSSSWWCAVRLRQSRTGMIRVKTMTSLNALAQNDENDSSRPTSSAPAAASG